MNDPLERFLATDFSGRAPPRLRQSVLDTTSDILRRRRRWRRLAWTAALAGCFLAGMATTAVWHQPPRSRELPHAPQLQDDPATFAAPASAPEVPTLVELEWRAFDSHDNRAALFFEVGQRYFEDEQDLTAALRCYRQALDAAPPEDLAIRPGDNWLVMALKEARQKEKNDADINP